MKYIYIVIFVIILLFVGCVPQEIPKEPPTEPTEQPAITTPQPEPEEEPQPVQEEPNEEEQPLPEEEPPQVEEGQEVSEEEQLQQIFGYAKTKIQSYSYQYKDPSGRQYNIYIKDNKMVIGGLSDYNKIFIDTEKNTAEEYCTSHTKCGRQTGKIADLDYYDAYVETPIDWVAKITESEKIDEGSYYGKKSWKLSTNIGEVVIDSNYGFIYSIKKEGKEYLFTNAIFNAVKDSDVNIPEYLIEE